MTLAGAPVASAEEAPSAGDRYIVEVAAAPGESAQATATRDAAASVTDVGGVVEATMAAAYDGLVVTLPSDAAVTELLQDPNVVSVVKDQPVSIETTQNPAPSWGLDRIDQKSLPVDNKYTYTSDGAGVRAYIVDTGIRADQVDFAGRVESGQNFIADTNGTNDCNSHGTHVAGTVGGTTYGVAKAVTLIPVRVLDCTGNGWLSDVVLGLDWVVSDMNLAGHLSSRAVVNMSIGGNGIYDPLDTAIHNATLTSGSRKGIVVVVAAGNSNANACDYSPAAAPDAITVAATASNDARASYSNWGSCVDLFAPGSSIISDSNASNNGSSTKSGTSMASPHVAGVAATYLATQPSLTPAQVLTKLAAEGERNLVSDAGTGSPNLLLRALHTDPVAPDAPTSVAGTAGDASVDLTWTAPAVDGGAAVNGYAVYYTTNDGGTYTTVTANTGSAANSRTVGGLTNNTAYKFAVEAVNSAGTSVKSSLSAAVTPVAPPDPVASDPPTGVTGTAGDASVAITWSAPVSNGGAAVSGYAVYYTTNNGDTYTTVIANTGTTATSRTVTGLANGTAYKFAVAAVNRAGISAKSSRSAAVTPVAAPVAAPPPSSGGGGGGGGSSPSSGGGGGGGAQWSVVEVRPSSGSTSGGTRVLVLGYGMWGATSVTIGGVPAPSFTYIDAGTLEIITPAGTAGWQELRVILPSGSAPAAFKYEQGQTSPPTSSPSTPALTSTSRPGPHAAAPTTVTARSNTPTVNAGQRVSLSVVVIAGGTPVAGAKVSIRFNGRTFTSVTDGKGRAMFTVTARTTTRYAVKVAATATSSASRSTATLKVRAAKRH